ncbi:MAG: metallophosphoesterase [Bacteroidales bacterium]|nr:metallophosphoesterase [Bacteroidales bacterium]
MLIRLITLLLLLVALLVYVGWHVWAVVPLPIWAKWALVGVGLLCFALEFVGFTPLMNRLPLGLASAVYNIGNKTLIIICYMVMAFLLLDLGRLVHLVPRTMLHDSLPTSVGMTVLMAIVFVYAGIHYNNKKRVAIDVDSGGRTERPLTLVMASDLHVGYHNRRADLARWVDLINAENPDLVLIAGDIIDFSFRPVIEEDMAAEFRRIKAPIYACLGNHEYIAGEPDAERFYREAGINLLIDSAVCVDGITIIGRDDRSNKRRKTLKEFDIDDSAYTILLDHQPYHLEEAEQAGIDFQLSGHTHRGQIWPVSWITDALYECSWGSHQRGNTRYYVSSGLGIWGAKFRIGTQSEYVVANLSGKRKAENGKRKAENGLTR